MSLRLKLYMSYLAMAFVPIIMMVLLMVVIFLVGGRQDLREFTDAEQNENFNQALIYGELAYVLRADTDQLENPVFVEELQGRLSEQWSGIIMAKNGEVVEVSPFLEQLSPTEDWQALSDAGATDQYSYFQLYRFVSHKISFAYPDGSEGMITLLRRADPIPAFYHPLSLVASLLFVGLTSLLLTYFVSRSIIRPIHSLRAAVLRIKDGELSHELRIGEQGKGRSNEIVQLSAAFEEMRIRLKQSIEQSLQYEENRKQLLSHISHDLKTPISAIKGYVEGIMDGIANTDEKRDRYMQTIYRKASDMDQLIDELFLFSKLDLHRVAYDFTVVDMKRYIQHYIEEQRFDLEKAGITLHFESLSERELPVAADPDKLNRVLGNILDNSAKYVSGHNSSGDSFIAVKISGLEKHALITIEDNGPGIGQDDLHFVFDRFYRAEQSRNSETGGSGLGLAIVKQIVEGHGGQVWADNKPEGGARFYIKLPLTYPAKAVNGNEEHPDY